MQPIHQHRLSNGLWLLAEPSASAQSLAMTLLTPAGVAGEPATQQGVAAMLAEMVCRGAGDLDTRAHSDALDHLGVQRSTSVSTFHLRLSAVMLAPQLPQALPLLTDMVRRPMLPEAALEPSRDLCLQSLEALEDEPQDKVFIELRQRHEPQPWGRSSLGVRAHLEALTLAQVREYWKRSCAAQGSILGFAGRFDWPQLRDLVEEHLGAWSGAAAVPPAAAPAPRGYLHLPAPSTQVHIGLAYDAPRETDADCMLQRAAVAVLSGGMSGRLFTQVREKRGLCYSVGARYLGDQFRGTVGCYAGTTAARAQETLEVLVAELRRLSEGIDENEFQRAVVGMKSSLVMQGESTSARAGAIAADQFIHGCPRRLDELAAQVDAISLDALRQFVIRRPPADMTVVTIGPTALKAG